jgi:hypothetical protein
MKEYYKQKLPQWYKEEKQYDLILTDDIDSLLGCSILSSRKGWNIEQVMLFKANKDKNEEILKDYLGVTDNATNEAVGVDFALMNGKCFDNHLTLFSSQDKPNSESININNICGIHRGIYGKKYALSTVLLLWSLYDLPKENLSDELMMVLLAIDSSFEGYYSDYFRQYNKKFMVDVLDLPEFYACMERHTYFEFKDIIKKYRLKEKIKASKRQLQTGIDISSINKLLSKSTDIQIELPKSRFKKKAEYKDIAVEIKGFPSSIETICDNPFCYAMTKKNWLNYSEEIAG